MAIEIVDFPIKNGDFPWQNVSSPEGNDLSRSRARQRDDIIGGFGGIDMSVPSAFGCLWSKSQLFKARQLAYFIIFQRTHSSQKR